MPPLAVPAHPAAGAAGVSAGTQTSVGHNRGSVYLVGSSRNRHWMKGKEEGRAGSIPRERRPSAPVPPSDASPLALLGE